MTSDELVRPIESHARTVGGALSVIFGELAAHDRFMNRDLDQLDETGVRRAGTAAPDGAAGEGAIPL